MVFLWAITLQTTTYKVRAVSLDLPPTMIRSKTLDCSGWVFATWHVATWLCLTQHLAIKHKTGPTIRLSSSVLKVTLHQPALNPLGLQAFEIKNSNLISWRWALNPFCCHSQPGSFQRVILLNQSKTQTRLTANYWAKPRQVWARQTYSERNRDKFHSCNVNRWLIELRFGNQPSWNANFFAKSWRHVYTMYILNDNVICSCLQKVRHRMAKVSICFHFSDCHPHKVLNDKYIK